MKIVIDLDEKVIKNVKFTRAILAGGDARKIAVAIINSQPFEEIINSGNCNNCKIRSSCKDKPPLGKLVRYNCINYVKESRP